MATSSEVRQRSKEKRSLRDALESKAPKRKTFADYRRYVQKQYDGWPGALTRVTGVLTGHEVLADNLFSPRGFDVRGCKSILDAGCGDGRYSKFLLRRADSDARLTGFDYSLRMLVRASKRLKSSRVSHAAADITRLPYADRSFDAVVCGWVLEHLPDPAPGLRELARVLQPGGKMLLMATEDTLNGAVCSRLWKCRTYNRHELRQVCEGSGLLWARELWFTKLHAALRMGGIVVELHRK